MCAAICWMLQGWIPAPWALLGGVLAVARLGLLSYFTNGYWSSCLPAVGGALVLRISAEDSARCEKVSCGGSRRGTVYLGEHASVRRIFVECRSSDRAAVVDPGQEQAADAGLAGPLCFAAGVDACAPGRFGLVIIIIALREAHSKWRMTQIGKRMQWGDTSFGKNPGGRKVSTRKMRAYYERELSEATENRTVRGFFRRAGIKLYYFWQVYLVQPLPFFLIALPCAVRDRRLRVPWMIGGIFVIGLAVEVWFLPHYFAPAAALLYLILMQCARHLPGLPGADDQSDWHWYGRSLSCMWLPLCCGRASRDARASGKTVATWGYGARGHRQRTEGPAGAARGAGEIRSGLRSGSGVGFQWCGYRFPEDCMGERYGSREN